MAPTADSRDSRPAAVASPAAGFHWRAIFAPLTPHTRAAAAMQLGALIALGFLIRAAFVQMPGYVDDVTIFRDWFKSIAVSTPGDVYRHTPGLN